MASVIAVMGATGQQGGGLVDALLAKGGYKIRALTRSPDSEKAKTLAGRSPDIEVVKGDTGNIFSLIKAFTGVQGAFIVTDSFSAGFQYDAEVEQGKVAVDAAKEAGVPFVVFSSREDPRPALRGKGVKMERDHAVTHFETKAAIEEYLKGSGLAYATVLTGCFHENALSFWQFKEGEDGVITFSDNMGSDTKTAWHAVGDVGASAAAIFADPSKYKGATVPVVGEFLSPNEFAGVLSRLCNKTVKHHQASDEEVGSAPYPGAKDVAAMFMYHRLCPEAVEMRPLDKRVFTGPTFSDWADQHADELKAKILERA